MLDSPTQNGSMMPPDSDLASAQVGGNNSSSDFVSPVPPLFRMGIAMFKLLDQRASTAANTMY